MHEELKIFFAPSWKTVDNSETHKESYAIPLEREITTFDLPSSGFVSFIPAVNDKPLIFKEGLQVEGKWRNWNLEYLELFAAETSIPVIATSNGLIADKFSKNETLRSRGLKYSEFLERILYPQLNSTPIFAEGEKIAIYQNKEIFNNKDIQQEFLSSIHGDFHEFLQPSDLKISIEQNGLVDPLHKSLDSELVFQLRGEKEFLLFDSAQSDYLYAGKNFT